MNTPSGQLIKCSCCLDPVDETKAYVDPDLKTPVCPDCKVALRWGQAWLKKAHIVGCIQPD